MRVVSHQFEMKCKRIFAVGYNTEQQQQETHRPEVFSVYFRVDQRVYDRGSSLVAHPKKMERKRMEADETNGLRPDDRSYDEGDPSE
jgi:hypothetical protein